MRPWVRRGILVGVLVGVGVAVWKLRGKRSAGTAVVTSLPQPVPVAPGPESVARTPAAPWTAPHDDGTCPVSHPIKGKVRTGIYHPPGAFAYDRTHADRCYRDADAAEADGLRAAKR